MLRWATEKPALNYTLRVRTETLAPILEVSDLDRPAYEVPPATLANLPADTKLLWQVDALYEHGQRSTSTTFINRLE